MERTEAQLMESIVAEHEERPDPKLSGARLKLHLNTHLVVENQLAVDDPPAVKQTLDRLVAAGLTRHQATHAIGSVVTEVVLSIMRDGEKFDGVVYVERLSELNAANFSES